MTPDNFCGFVLLLQNRSKKLAPYHEEIVSWRKEHPDLTGAQIFYWLEERLDVNSIAEYTVRIYANDLRDIYHIPKQAESEHSVPFPRFHWVNRFKYILERRRSWPLKWHLGRYIHRLCVSIFEVQVCGVSGWAFPDKRFDINAWECLPPFWWYVSRLSMIRIGS